MPNVAMQNAWLLYRRSRGDIERPMDLLTFRRDVERVYRSKYSRRQPLYTMPCPPALPRSRRRQCVTEATIAMMSEATAQNEDCGDESAVIAERGQQ